MLKILRDKLFQRSQSKVTSWGSREKSLGKFLSREQVHMSGLDNEITYNLCYKYVAINCSNGHKVKLHLGVHERNLLENFSSASGSTCQAQITKLFKIYAINTSR